MQKIAATQEIFSGCAPQASASAGPRSEPEQPGTLPRDAPAGQAIDCGSLAGCNSTHWAGCPCHEARRDEELSALRTALSRIAARECVESNEAGLYACVAHGDRRQVPLRGCLGCQLRAAETAESILRTEAGHLRAFRDAVAAALGCPESPGLAVLRIGDLKARLDRARDEAIRRGRAGRKP